MSDDGTEEAVQFSNGQKVAERRNGRGGSVRKPGPMRHFILYPRYAVAAGMKGMEQVAAGSTWLIQQGNILISEMESLPKRNLLPWCLKSWLTSV